MATRARHSSKANFFSPEVLEFLKRRYSEILGLTLCLIGTYLLLSLISYEPSDPSFNTAIKGDAQNYGGYLGAILADLLHQPFGKASYFLPFYLFIISKLKLTHTPIHHWALKLLAVPLVFVVLSLSLASLAFALGASPVAWGGAIGGLSWQKIAPLLPGYNTFITPMIFGLLLFITGAIVMQLLSGHRWRQWNAILHVLFNWTQALFRVHRTLMQKIKTISFAHVNATAQAKQVAKPRATPQTQHPTSPPQKPSPDGEQSAPLELSTTGEYQLPPLDLLAQASDKGKISQTSKHIFEAKAQELMGVLEDFGVRGEIAQVRPGPVVTLYELVPAPGIKASRVIGLADDIARSMSAISARVAVIPGCNAIGIELPNETRQTVYLRELLSSKIHEQSRAELALALGHDIGGTPVVADLARMPHLLVAGTTGSGKSVAINSMILSLLYRLSPEQCKLIMIDPKMLELSVYDGIPHLLSPVVTDPAKAVMALKWAVREMEDRYRAMSKLGVRNIIGYNLRVCEAKARGESLTRKVQTGFDPETQAPLYETQDLDLQSLPYIVIVVDEMADLMLVAGKDIEASVQRLAQMARAAGLHLIMATQRPSVDVITGTIKANFPTRISFSVSSKIDSRTILGEQGAEQLLGQGDMLYMASGGRVARVHGPFVSDEEVERIVAFLKSQGSPNYVTNITEEIEGGFDDLLGGEQNSGDELYDQALALICRERKASTSFIQRHLQIGYNRAARIIDRMETEGVVSPANHVGKREILIQPTED
ncbi:MAG: DNA translocase FtsK 4TM domain-containing protein [Pseudomonadota bacterium]